MKRLKKQAAVFIMAVLLAAVSVCGCETKQPETNDTKQSKNQKESVEITEAARTFLPADGEGSDAEKEEMVYVVADASGKAEQTIVSTWLKNPDAKDVLTDYSDLSDIENVKGDENFTDNGNGKLTWQAEGKDIYYQGTSKRELPVTMKISYQLDGVSKQPEELAGANGHLKITLAYTNHVSEMKNIGGVSTRIYEPFLVLSALSFDNEKAADVRVSNGKLVNMGDKTLAVGYALPGLKDSLASSIVKAGADEYIPDSVVVEADVTDFSLLTMITVIDNSLLNDLELDHVDTLDQLKAAMGQMSDASGQLVDGSGKLYDGLNTLSEKVPALTDGMEDLDDGAAALETGSKDLKDGAAQLSSGLSGLSSGVSALPDSVDRLYKGTLQVSAALKGDMYTGAGQIEQGAGGIAQGAERISAGAGGIMNGAEQIAGAAGQISAGAGALQSEMGNMAASMNEMLPLLEQYPELYEQLGPVLQEYQTKIVQAQGALSQIQTGANGISAGAKSGDSSNPGIYEAAAGISAGAKSGDNSNPGICEAANALGQGAAAIQGGIDQITSDQNLGAISNGLAVLEEKSKELVGGTAQLSQGAKKLSDGSGQLSKGASTLHTGTKQLKKGGDSLVSGIAQLLEGAGKLKDGLVTFDEEGIAKLASFVSGDGTNLIERLKAVKEMGTSYTTFSGKEGAAKSKVQFIIRTDSIGE